MFRLRMHRTDTDLHLVLNDKQVQFLFLGAAKKYFPFQQIMKVALKLSTLLLYLKSIHKDNEAILRARFTSFYSQKFLLNFYCSKIFI